jgi:hypothetical protein
MIAVGGLDKWKTPKKTTGGRIRVWWLNTDPPVDSMKAKSVYKWVLQVKEDKSPWMDRVNVTSVKHQVVFSEGDMAAIPRLTVFHLITLPVKIQKFVTSLSLMSNHLMPVNFSTTHFKTI